MHIRKKKNRSGRTSVVIVDKSEGYKELCTIGTSDDSKEIERLFLRGQEWIDEHNGQTALDLNGWEEEEQTTKLLLEKIEDVLINGTELVLDHAFRSIGFDRIKDAVLRALVISRLSFPSSKAATAEYLKAYYDEDVSLDRIYRYLDKLNSKEQERVQEISVRHTKEILGGTLGVVFYDVTTLYFETDYEDELRIPGWSKDGKHRNPQIILGLLVSLGGYPLAYCIHEGNKYEGKTMLPIVEGFVKKYDLEDFIIVADSGLMNKENIRELEALGYRYILGARIKNMAQSIQAKVLGCNRVDGAFEEIQLSEKRRLLVGWSGERARKDAYNRDKGIRRLEKAFKQGKLGKEQVNRRGYNKFLEMKGKVSVSINYDKVQQDQKWDGLKGYVTNADKTADEIYDAYKQLWRIERTFRVAKSKLEIRPIFHFTRKRIQAHICICFIALKVYKELERRLALANIPMSVDKVLFYAKTITTIRVKMKSGKVMTRTMFLKPWQKAIAPLFDEQFWAR